SRQPSWCTWARTRTARCAGPNRCCPTPPSRRREVSPARTAAARFDIPSTPGPLTVPRRRAVSFTASHLYFDDVEVGQEWESQGRTVTETDIVNFAGISGDFNPIHTDHEFCTTTPYRQTIA